jgi:DNA-binding NarL/FixJ family response regulator
MKRSATSPEASDVATLAVDDHEGFLDALDDLIATTPGFVLVGRAASGEEAVQVAGRVRPRLVIMDVRMPGIGGIAAARAIVSLLPAVLVVLVSTEDPATYPGASDLGHSVACARKQDLGVLALTRIWKAHRAMPDRGPVRRARGSPLPAAAPGRSPRR